MGEIVWYGSSIQARGEKRAGHPELWKVWRGWPTKYPLSFAEHSFLNLFEQPAHLQLGAVSGSLSLASAIERKVYDSLKTEMLSWLGSWFLCRVGLKHSLHQSRVLGERYTLSCAYFERVSAYGCINMCYFFCITVWLAARSSSCSTRKSKADIRECFKRIMQSEHIKPCNSLTGQQWSSINITWGLSSSSFGHDKSSKWNLLILYFWHLQMLSSSKDVNFVGYTYKNFEIVQDVQVPGVGECLGLAPVRFW